MSQYPMNWPEIAHDVKERAGWRCEHCGHVHDRHSGRVLTVHHLDMNKANCDYSNLVALCQRCHLHIQARYHPKQLWLFGKPAWAVARGL